MGPFDIAQETDVVVPSVFQTANSLATAPGGANTTIDWTSGYFSVQEGYKERVLDSRATVRIVTASPEVGLVRCLCRWRSLTLDLLGERLLRISWRIQVHSSGVHLPPEAVLRRSYRSSKAAETGDARRATRVEATRLDLPRQRCARPSAAPPHFADRFDSTRDLAHPFPQLDPPCPSHRLPPRRPSRERRRTQAPIPLYPLPHPHRLVQLRSSIRRARPRSQRPRHDFFS